MIGRVQPVDRTVPISGTSEDFEERMIELRLLHFRRRFPRAEVHRFPEAGHYVLEDEGDRIIPLVRDFLAAHPVRRESV